MLRHHPRALETARRRVASTLRHLCTTPCRSTDAAATERFNRLASQWDASPSALKRVQLMGDAVRSSAWWKELGPGTTRAMDFGCGTGLLSFELMEPGAMSILGGTRFPHGSRGSPITTLGAIDFPLGGN